MNAMVKATLHPDIWGAYLFADKHHKGQVRKYIEEPYINHPYRVAEMVVGAIGIDEISVNYDAVQIVMAALLHDVVEDCDVSVVEIYEKFGSKVGYMVKKLSNPGPAPGINRADRKFFELMDMADASGAVKLIRLADMLDNAPSIIEHDPKFAKLMVKEKRELLPLLLNSGYPEMFEAVFKVLYVDYENHIKKGAVK